jgi:ADP-dependent NAD(P)H-hydrate dehydratase / NAD(P)H-hydrate epimerase
MRPVVSVAEMRAADELALQSVDEQVLIGRAGFAAATVALEMLGGAYGRRIVVIAGKGNNGNDGRVAAAALTRRGALVEMIEAADAPERIASVDLVIDAAYGTGFSGSYEPPEVASGTPVLAVDIPSGVHGDSGQIGGRALRADRTVTFAALKPGLLMGEGAAAAGPVTVADIGIPIVGATIGLVEDSDLHGVPQRPWNTHKWASAVAVVAGSPGMEGASFLCARGAARAGAGMVRLAVPGADEQASGPWPIEAVRMPLGSKGWADEVLGVLGRCRALVVGPGLGRDEVIQAEVRRLIASSPVPVVADADALFALGDVTSAREVITAAGANRPVVLTPHDGEYRRLSGEDPGPDRIAAARRLADSTGAVVLVKGSLTAVAAPSGADAPVPGVLLAAAGSPVLATAGTGDVLSGIIGAFIARGLPILQAAAFGAHVHGSAARGGRPEGLVSVDLPDLVSDWLSRLDEPHG